MTNRDKLFLNYRIFNLAQREVKTMEKSCERQKKGMPDNCALCKALNKRLYELCDRRGLNE